MDQNRLIGNNNALPWHLPADLAFFKRTTMGKPILMGRKTHQSIGKPLPGRRNIVISRDPNFQAPGCELVGGLDEALSLSASAEEAMLIGGASLYEQALPQIKRMYVTYIHHVLKGDTWFPEIDEREWQLEFDENFEPDHNNHYPYSFKIFVR